MQRLVYKIKGGNMHKEIIYSKLFEVEQLYSGKAVVKIHIRFMGIDGIASVKLFNKQKLPDCCIIHRDYGINLRTEKGIKGEKYESIEELKKECYDKLKNHGIEPIALIVSDLIYMKTYPFIKENKSKEEIIRISDDLKLDYKIRIIPSNDLLVIPKVLAENNLSEDAIGLAEELDNYYIWELSTTSWVVLFEMPKVFNATFQEVLRGLIKYNLEYLTKNNLHDNIIYNIFTQNLEKKIIE